MRPKQVIESELKLIEPYITTAPWALLKLDICHKEFGYHISGIQFCNKRLEFHKISMVHGMFHTTCGLFSGIFIKFHMFE